MFGEKRRQIRAGRGLPGLQDDEGLRYFALRRMWNTNHSRQLDSGVSVQRLFDFERGYVLATSDYDLFLAPLEPEKAISIDSSKVFADRLKEFDVSIERFERRLDLREETLIQRFSALERIVSGLQSQQGFLSSLA